MSVFLIAVPRNDEARAETFESVRRITNCFSSFLGPRYKHQASVRHDMSITGAILVEWSTSDESNARRIGSSWSVSSSANISARVIRSIDSSIDGLRLKYPVWGSYSTATGQYSSDRLAAWATVPGIDAIHYSCTDKTIFISNRPLAIAAAKTKDSLEEIELDEEYLQDYLSFGFSFSGASPFVGISTVPSGQAIFVYRGDFELVAAPPQTAPPLTQHTEDYLVGTETLIESLRNATRRLLDTLGDSPIQLRLSGGKDSRLMLGLLLDAGAKNIVAVTQGEQTSQEVMVAAELTELAGIEHHVIHARLSVPTSVWDSVVQTVRDSQGMLLSEAAGMPFAFADPIQIGEAYAAGQWPTFKAPYVRRLATSLEELDTEWKSHIADNLSDRMLERAERAIHAWGASMAGLSNNDLLYLYGRNIRASNYMHASSIAIDNYSSIFFPFVDSEVTAVSDTFPDEIRRSEIPLFLAMRRLWPESLAVPLARGGKFRFERGGPVEGISGHDFQQRVASPRARDLVVRNPEYLDVARDRELLENPIREGARLVIASPNWPYLQSFLSQNFVSLVLRIAESESEHDVLLTLRTRRKRILTRAWIWRLVAADAWLSKRWLN